MPGGGVLVIGPERDTNFFIFPPTVDRRLDVVAQDEVIGTLEFQDFTADRCEWTDSDVARWIACEAIANIEWDTGLGIASRDVTSVEATVTEDGNDQALLGFYYFGSSDGAGLRVNFGFQKPKSPSVHVSIKKLRVDGRWISPTTDASLTMSARP